ncbi:hypothetical protein TW95_gp0783 [Pandoravirus inopinatum]|uniref:F-box domain protein n=1 Tax=Pandoravirus inopinatum TaxID=1605721 RepID=A0A0B5JCW8_9VIRU|nr:hypothetical protein TW95_gp0783 [Pandoravirus inopinatum]AJF97517.1 hypothetical protein [Pandoravirus inopinatum]
MPAQRAHDTSLQRLDHCPIACLADHFAHMVTIVINYLAPADLARLARVSKATLRALAESIALGEGAQSSRRPMPIPMARLILSSLARARSMTKTLGMVAASNVVWTRRDFFKGVSAKHADGDGYCDDSDANCARVGINIGCLVDQFDVPYGTVPRRAVLHHARWPLRNLWTLMESAEIEGRHDIADVCLATLGAMDEDTRAYATRLWHRDTRDRIALDICHSMGLLVKDGCLRTTLLQTTWAPPLRLAHLAGRCRSGRLVTAALDAATRQVAQGIHLTRDGHQVLRLLAPEPHDPCAHAAAATHVVTAVLAALFDNLGYGSADSAGSTDHVFDLIERTVCDTILPAVNRHEGTGSSGGTTSSDPAYKAALDQIFDALCSRLVAFLRLRDHGTDSLSSLSSPLVTVFYRTIYLVGRIVRRDVGKHRVVSRRLVSLWPEIGQRLWGDDTKDASACLLLMAGLSGRSSASGMPTPTIPDHRFECDVVDGDSVNGGDNSDNETDASTFAVEADRFGIADDDGNDNDNNNNNDNGDLLGFLLGGDPAVAAHLFSYLDPVDMGTLAFASRRAFLLVTRMVMPRHQGRPPVMPQVCDRSHVFQADSLTMWDPCMRLLDPLFDDEGNERPMSLGRGLALIGLACRRLPRLRDAVIRLVVNVQPRDREAPSRGPNRAKLIMRQIRQLDETAHYKRIANALAGLMVAAVDARSGSVVNEAAVLASHLASRIGPDFAGGAGEICFVSPERDQAPTGLPALRGAHRQLSIDWAWCPVLSLVRIAARRRDAALLRIACAMAHTDLVIGSTKQVVASLAIAILDSAIDQLERMPRGPDDATAHFLDCLAACMPHDAKHAHRLQLEPRLSTESGPPKAPITSLSLRLFLLCTAQRTVSRHCAELIRSLASLAL